MKRFAESIARQKRIRPPAGYATSIEVCRGFLEEHAPRKTGGPTAETVDRGKTEQQPVPSEHSERPTRKRRRNAAPKAAGPARKKAPPGARTRKRKQGDAPLDPHADRLQPEVRGNTPLRIPYGNKEVAQQLGARYSADGWYAPPGVDLRAFKEKGWL
jgi:DNA topoisomerase-3